MNRLFARRSLQTFCVITGLGIQPLQASEWPSFRGPNGSGVSEARDLPVEFGPDRNVLWKVAVPEGKSSPILAGERIFLTAHEGDQRLVLAFDSRTGHLLWRQAVVKRHEESRNERNGPASPSPVTDGENVYAFFSDSGLISYSRDGKERWSVPLGPFDTEHGASVSPILYRGSVVLLADQIQDSYLAAFDSADGSLKWKTERPSLLGAYSTPIVHEPDKGPAQIIAASPAEIVGYSAQTGKKLWWVSGLAYQPRSLPVLGRDAVYVNVGGFGGGSGPPFERVAEELDKNKDGKIALDELPRNPGNRFMPAMLRRWGGEDAAVDAGEWQQAQNSLSASRSLLAVRLGGRGDLTETNVRWRLSKFLPNVPSPLLYEGVLYLFKDGGIVTAVDPSTGKVLKQGRIRDAIDKYFSSPVAADGKIFVASETGKVAVLKAGPGGEVLAVNNIGEGCYATPALADGRIYLRTRTTLYCFRENDLVSRVRQGDAEAVKTLLARGDVRAESLASALSVATKNNQVAVADLLRGAGATLADTRTNESGFSLEVLNRYVGEYQTEQGWESSIVLEDGILLLKRWGQESRLNPIDEKTFRVDERVPMTVTFEFEGDLVAGFTSASKETTLAFKKVEPKE